MVRLFSTVQAAVVLFVVAGFVGVVRAEQPAPDDGYELRMCKDDCRNGFLQCLVDGGFEQEAPYQACRAAYAACLEDCSDETGEPSV